MLGRGLLGGDQRLTDTHESVGETLAESLGVAGCVRLGDLLSQQLALTSMCVNEGGGAWVMYTYMYILRMQHIPLHTVYPLTLSFTYSLTQSPTHSLTHSPTYPTHSPTHPLTHSPTHPLTHSPTHSLIHPPIHSLTHPPTHSFTHLSTLSPTHPLTHLSTPSPTHSLIPSYYPLSYSHSLFESSSWQQSVHCLQFTTQLVHSLHQLTTVQMN